MLTNPISFRPGVLADKAFVTELCKDVWGGHDYLPQWWDEIVSDPANLFFMAEIEGQLAGLYSLNLQLEGKSKAAWWQAVRVGTSFQRQGLAAKMLEHALAVAREHDLQIFRYATGETNTPMHKIADRFNFSYIATYSYYYNAKIDLLNVGGSSTPDTAVSRLSPSDFEQAWQFVQIAPSFNGLYCDLWVWKDLEAVTLQKIIEGGQAYGYFDSEQLTALALIKPSQEQNGIMLFVTWLDGAPAALVHLLSYLQSYSVGINQANKNQSVIGFASPNQNTLIALQRSGLKLEPEEDLRVYALSL